MGPEELNSTAVRMTRSRSQSSVKSPSAKSPFHKKPEAMALAKTNLATQENHVLMTKPRTRKGLHLDKNMPENPFDKKAAKSTKKPLGTITNQSLTKDD